MYEIRDFNDAGEMLGYLNELGGHDLVHIEHNHDNWMVMVKLVRIGRPPKKVEEKVEQKVEDFKPTTQALPVFGFPMRDDNEA